MTLNADSVRLRPGRLLVRVVDHDVDTVTDAGIYLPYEAQGEGVVRARVLSVAGDVRAVEAGSDVLVARYAGHDLGDDYRICREDELLALVEE